MLVCVTIAKCPENIPLGHLLAKGFAPKLPTEKVNNLDIRPFCRGCCHNSPNSDVEAAMGSNALSLTCVKVIEDFGTR